MNSVLCIGVDPAPSGAKDRGNAIVKIRAGFDEPMAMEDHVCHRDLRKRLEDWKTKNVLLAWDAPLTGPTDPESKKAGSHHEGLEADFTMRRIERVVRQLVPKRKRKGISVQDYAGCQHWALTRNLLGLPRVGPYDKEDVPFKLRIRDPWKAGKPSVVEVHPALAMWFWLSNDPPKDYDWRYKDKKVVKENRRGIREHLLQGLMKIWQKSGIPVVKETDEDWERLLSSADLIDAYVAAVLAALWVKDDGVTLVGDEESGAFLLPKNDMADKLKRKLENGEHG